MHGVDKACLCRVVLFGSIPTLPPKSSTRMRPTRFRLANAPSPSGPGTTAPTEAKPVKPAGSAFDALEHTGLPTGWLRKPKLPGRNWLIFYGVVSTLGYLYWDDRRKCRAIKAEYIEKVKHLAEVPLGSAELPRKVDVYACKWPGDEEYDRSLKFFKRYVKVRQISPLACRKCTDLSTILAHPRCCSD